MTNRRNEPRETRPVELPKEHPGSGMVVGERETPVSIALQEVNELKREFAKIFGNESTPKN